jgi:hypothetical protein
MATTYTTRLRLNKPDFRTSPWSAQINENMDRLDEVFYKILQANSIIIYQTGLLVEPGQILYDPDGGGTLWINNTEHTTEATGAFVDERLANPTYWSSLSVGVQAKGQWQRDTFYPLNCFAYDSTQGLAGVCIVEHTSPSTGSMRDSPEADNWIFLIDSQGPATTPATDISFDPTGLTITEVNVQLAIAAEDERIDNAATVVAGVIDDVTALQALTAGLNVSDTLTKSGNLAGIADAATARANIGALGPGDVVADAVLYTAQTLDAGQKAQANTNIGSLPSIGGTMTGTLTISAGGANITDNTTITGELKVNKYAGDTAKGIIRFNAAATSYLYWDAAKFNFSHLAYASNGRLWGASDFSSIPPQATTSMRWVSGGTTTGQLNESSPYILSAFQFDGVNNINTRRYLQYYINGTWYTVGFV